MALMWRQCGAKWGTHNILWCKHLQPLHIVWLAVDMPGKHQGKGKKKKPTSSKPKGGRPKGRGKNVRGY